MRPLLLLRADAGGFTGSGHVMRMLALAAAWARTGGACTLATHDIPPALAARAREAGIDIAPLALRTWDASGAAALLALARDRGARAAAVDSYLAEEPYLGALHAAGLPTLFVDDVARLRNYPCAVLVNQNLGAVRARYEGGVARPLLLLGPSYALLRREFAALRDRAAPDAPARSRRLLVTFGGVDPKNATAIALAALRLCLEIEAEVIIGGANERAEALAAPAPNVRLVRDVRDMAARIAGADMMLAAGGSTMLEAAALGAPMILVASAPEEERTAAHMAAATGALYLGRVEDLRADALAGAIVRFAHDRDSRVKAAAAGRALVDGRGADRVVAALHAAIG